MAVKYQVERRPVGEDGSIYRGTGVGDYITLMTHRKLMESTYTKGGLLHGIRNVDKAYGNPSWVAADKDTPELKTNTAGDATYTHFKEAPGEPWLVNSTHYSVESATATAAPLAAAIGADNVRIVKVLSHRTEFKLK